MGPNGIDRPFTTSEVQTLTVSGDIQADRPLHRYWRFGLLNSRDLAQHVTGTSDLRFARYMANWLVIAPRIGG